MKRKAILIILTSAIIFTGCGIQNKAQISGPTESPAKSDQNISTEDDLSELDSIGDVKLEKEVFDVTLTIPAQYVGETTQEELDKTAKENGLKSITLNEDGSATYVMTKKQHKKMMADMADKINASLSEESVKVFL